MLEQTQADELWSYVKDIPVAMMATRMQGRIHARPMHKVQNEFAGTLWFFTDVTTTKTVEIEDTHDVCLSYQDTHKQLYISVSGTARVIRDPTLVDKFWNPMVGAWFPKGKADPNIGLIEVNVEQAEVWNSDSNRMTQLFKMAMANARNKRPDMGEHHQYGRH